MTREDDPFIKALWEFDIPAVRRLVAEGADLNARDAYGDPYLFEATYNSRSHDGAGAFDPRPYALVEALIELGADPRQLADDGGSILLGPMFSQDARMMELLLKNGVDPNNGCGEPWETVYSLASFDYWYEAWAKPGGEPGREPSDAELGDENAYLRYLDDEAIAADRPRPDILAVLRRYGALSNRDMARKLGGEGSEAIVWRDGGWHLNTTVETDGAEI
jgi:ankyrin repeat protein